MHDSWSGPRPASRHFRVSESIGQTSAVQQGTVYSPQFVRESAGAELESGQPSLADASEGQSKSQTGANRSD